MPHVPVCFSTEIVVACHRFTNLECVWQANFSTIRDFSFPQIFSRLRGMFAGRRRESHGKWETERSAFPEYSDCRHGYKEITERLHPSQKKLHCSRRLCFPRLSIQSWRCLSVEGGIITAASRSSSKRAAGPR